MALHQIIYTSCKRGIDGINDGQQVFSYDKGFSSYKKTGVEAMFAYQPFSPPPGQPMTDEFAATLPQSFSYRKFENDIYSIALKTYLGRDYMGGSSRFGNTLSHVIVSDEKLSRYPCDYFDSTSFRSKMSFEEVNNPERPDFLEVPVLERGFVVDCDSVIEFLSFEDRFEIYKDMLHAAISRKSSKKRVLIHDSPENIIMWISAVLYALPLNLALNINFSTYEFNSAFSSSHICGVFPEQTTRDGNNEKTGFLFDIINNDYPTFEKDIDFFEHIEIGMSVSYDLMKDFFEFLEKFKYDELDEDIYSAFQLYKLFVGDIPSDSDNLRKAVAFSEKYGAEDINYALAEKLFEFKETLSETDSETYIFYLNYIAEYMRDLRADEKNELSEKIIKGIISKKLNGFDSDNSFYNSVCRICSKININIAEELINYKDKIFSMLNSNTSVDYIDFVIFVINEYKNNRQTFSSDFDMGGRIGSLYVEAVMILYKNRSNQTIYAIKKILESVLDNHLSLVKTAMNLVRINESNSEYCNNVISNLSEHIYEKHIDKFGEICSFLYSEKEPKLAFYLYKNIMNACLDADIAFSLLNNLYSSILVNNVDLEKKAAESVCRLYYEKICVLDSKPECYKNLFSLLCSRKTETSFSADLMNRLTESFSFFDLSLSQKKLVSEMVEYSLNVLRLKPDDKILFIYYLINIKSVESMNDLKILVNRIGSINNYSTKIPINFLTEKEFERFIDMSLESISEFARSSKDIEVFLSLFDFTILQEERFFELSCMFFLSLCDTRHSFDARRFLPFFDFLVCNGDGVIYKKTGKILNKKLSGKKYEILYNFLRDKCANKANAINILEEINQAKESGGFLSRFRKND